MAIASERMAERSLIGRHHHSYGQRYGKCNIAGNRSESNLCLKAYPCASGATISGGEKRRRMIEQRQNISGPGARHVAFSALSDRVPKPLPGGGGLRAISIRSPLAGGVCLSRLRRGQS